MGDIEPVPDRAPDTAAESPPRPADVGVRGWLPVACAAAAGAAGAVASALSGGDDPARDAFAAAALAGALVLLDQYLRARPLSDSAATAAVLPRFRLPDGSPLPRRLRIAQAVFAAAPGFAGRVLRRWIAPRIVSSVPESIVYMPDGRELQVRAGDRSYASVLLAGEYEPETSAALRRFAVPGSFAIDVGANQGWLALLMGKCVGPAGAVWAFEPTPTIVPTLRENLARNPDAPVRVFECAVGSEEGKTEINVFAGLPSVHASGATLGRSDATTYTVPLATLDSFRGDAPAPPALVKIDVEGAELAVLRGARELLGDADRAVIVLEVNYETSEAFGYRPVDLLEELRRHRAYRVFRAGRAGLDEDTNPGDAPHGATWVCVPPEISVD
jgi:FkbM family methyltransferase